MTFYGQNQPSKISKHVFQLAIFMQIKKLRRSDPDCVLGGNVGAFTLSADGREALLEGFGGGDIAQPSHYWVEANGVILDPGMSYLPKRSRMSAVSMPMIA